MSTIINLIFLSFVIKYTLDILLVVWCNLVYGVPYVPTDGGLIGEVAKRVKMTRGQKLIELGSGDGRMSSEFARRYPITAVGYEKNKFLLLVARWRAKVTSFKRGKVKFVDDDLFVVDLKRADVVYIYLLPWMIEKLKAKLEAMKTGARVVSFDYPLKSERFEMVDLIGKGKRKVAVYSKLK